MVDIAFSPKVICFIFGCVTCVCSLALIIQGCIIYKNEGARQPLLWMGVYGLLNINVAFPILISFKFAQSKWLYIVLHVVPYVALFNIALYEAGAFKSAGAIATSVLIGISDIAMCICIAILGIKARGNVAAETTEGGIN
nr:hypothetical transcript [Hymenolepis microstoma]